MRKLLRLTSALVLSLSLGTGFVGASSSSIGTTGPNSNNTVEFTNRQEREVRNDNRADIRNDNPQEAETGDVHVTGNTTVSGGGGSTGDARNDSLLRTTVTVNNSNCGCPVANTGSTGSDTGNISTTGPSSQNHITFDNVVEIDVRNDNDITVRNDNRQEAKSGDATVSNNTTVGGSPSTGDAENVSTLETTVSFTN